MRSDGELNMDDEFEPIAEKIYHTPNTARNRKHVMKKMLLILLICACVVKLWNVSKSYANEREIKAEVQSYAPAQVLVPQQTEKQESVPAQPLPMKNIEDDIIVQPESYEPLPLPTPEPIINPFVQELQEVVNGDIIGWLCIYGTNINYPVVQAGDNEKYLRRDIYGNDAKAGSLFTDYRCAQNFKGYSTVIYGHNMKNRSMFGDLRFYSDPDYFEENKHGVLYTSSKTYNLTIFAFMAVPSDDPYIYSNPHSIEELCEYIKENARIYHEYVQTDKILILSTCSYEFNNARYIIIASVK